MAKLESPRAKTRPRLEIIPFIDIMFFLLATFMMVSLSLIENSGIDLNLPIATTAKPSEQKPDQVTVSVDQEGFIYLGKMGIALDQLEDEFRAIKEKDPKTRIILQGDFACDFGRVVEVFDEARKVGLTKLIIRTKKPSVEDSEKRNDFRSMD